MIWTLDVMNKHAVATGGTEEDFFKLADLYNAPLLYMSKGRPFFISDGWLFSYEAPK